MDAEESTQQDFTEDVAEGDFQCDENGEEMHGDMEKEGNGETKQDKSAEAPGKDDDRKLFIGGLSWETTEQDLREHFSKYGEIQSINLKMDPNTGRSRGFSFIVFKENETLDKVIAHGEHLIGGKKIEPKKAKARHGKIFVGGLKTELTDEAIKKYFEQYGTIIEVEMPFDKTKNQRKGFCFITFEHESTVIELLKRPKQTIEGHEVDVKKATPKPEFMMMRGGMRGSGGPPGRGGGRGSGQRGGGRGGRGGWNQGWNGGYGGSSGGYGGYGGYGGSGGYGGYDYGGYGGYGGYDYGGYGGYGSGGYGGGGYGGGGYGGGYGGGKTRGRGGQRHQPY